MIMIIGVILVAVWLFLGVLGSGFWFAEFRANFKFGDLPEQRNFALFFAIFGPINLLVAFIMSGFGKYGWRLN